MASQCYAESAASDNQQPSTPAWHKLPTELHLEILNNLNSPQDILSLISADPLTLSSYMKYRQSILSSWEKELTDRLPDPIKDRSLVDTFEMTARMRVLRRRQKFYVEDTLRKVEDYYSKNRYKEEAEAILEGKGAQDELPQSLGFLCELFGLISDTDELISHYAPFEWSKQVVDDSYDTVGAVLEPSPDANLLPLTTLERYKLCKAIARLEAYTIATHYCGEVLDIDPSFFGLPQSDLGLWVMAHGPLINFNNIANFVSELVQQIVLNHGRDVDNLGEQDQAARKLLTSAMIHGQSVMMNADYLDSQGIHPLLCLMRSDLVRQKALDAIWSDHKHRYSFAMTPNTYIEMRPRYAYLKREPSALWDQWRLVRLRAHAHSFASQTS